jgi:hypothetical protein
MPVDYTAPSARHVVYLPRIVYEPAHGLHPYKLAWMMLDSLPFRLLLDAPYLVVF